LRNKFNINLKIIPHLKKQNSAENKNRGVNYVDKICEYIAFIDADDITYSSKLKDMTDFMLLHDADLGLHSYDPSHVDIKLTKNLNPEELREHEKSNRNKGFWINAGIGIHHGHILIKKEIFNSIKFDPECDYCEDALLIQDIFKSDKGYRGAYLNKGLVLYRSELSAIRN